MYAQRIRRNDDACSIRACDVAVASHYYRAVRNRFGVVENCLLSTAWNERSISEISAIGKSLRRDCQRGALAFDDHRTAKQAKQHERRIDSSHRLSDDPCHTLFSCCDIVKRAMWFHVLKSRTGGVAAFAERFDLRNDFI